MRFSPATVAALAAALVTTTSTFEAQAAEEKPERHDNGRDSDWHVALGVDTDAPLDVAGRIALETPGRFRLSTSLGATPAAYSGAIDGFLRSVNAYDAATSNLVRTAFDGTLVWRTHVGIRPVAHSGFYLEGGYTLVHLSGSLDGDQLGAATGVGSALDGSTYALSTTLHMLDAEIGWEFPLVQGFRLRTALGGAFTVGSSTDIEASGLPSAANGALAQADGEVNHVFRAYGFLPLLSVGLDYRLF